MFIFYKTFFYKRVSKIKYQCETDIYNLSLLIQKHLGKKTDYKVKKEYHLDSYVII